MLSFQDTITDASLKSFIQKLPVSSMYIYMYNVCHDKNQATKLNICIQIVSYLCSRHCFKLLKNN